MAVTKLDGKAVFFCHHCEERGAIPLEENNPTAEIRREKPVAAVAKELEYEWGPEHEEFFEGRKISPATLADYGIEGLTSHYFTDIGRSTPAVSLNYYNKTMAYAAKIRSTTEKAFSSNGSPQTLYGIDKVKIGDDLFFVEGELDVLAMAECGIRAVSLPNGAINKPCGIDDPTPENDQSRFKCLWDAKDYIDAASRVFIATDADAPGGFLAEELARRVGRAKCMKVDLNGYKDANDALIDKGPKYIVECVKDAEPWPVDGLYGASEYFDEIDRIFKEGLASGEPTGYPDVDQLYSVLPGDLSIVTGYPSSGKSEFVDQIMVNLAENKGWRFAVCSFENPPAYHICKFIQKRIRKPIFAGPTPMMSETEKTEGAHWVNDHFCFIHQSDGNLSNLASIIERIKAAVLRYGIRGVVIDPYNYIYRPRDMSETEWVTEMLTAIKVMAMSYGLHVWFVAHPMKMRRLADGSLPVPEGNDISGSAAWFSKADCGLTVHRNDTGPVSINVWKIRWAWVGKRGECQIGYSPATTTYHSIEIEMDPYGEALELERNRF